MLDGVERLREELLSKYPILNIVLKLGVKGSLFVNMTKDIYMPTVNTFNPNIMLDYEIVDTTGAGNYFLHLTFYNILR